MRVSGPHAPTGSPVPTTIGALALADPKREVHFGLPGDLRLLYASVWLDCLQVLSLTALAAAVRSRIQAKRLQRRTGLQSGVRAAKVRGGSDWYPILACKLR